MIKKIYTEKKNDHRQNCECACVQCPDEGLMSYLQMYSTGVCYVLYISHTSHPFGRANSFRFTCGVYFMSILVKLVDLKIMQSTRLQNTLNT